MPPLLPHAPPDLDLLHRFAGGAADDDLAGRVLGGRWVIEGELVGSGGQAHVLIAQHTAMSWFRVAVKLLSPEKVARHGERMFNEARLLATLRHPNLVQLLDAGQIDGRPFLVLELLGGHSMANAIERAGGKGWPVTRVLPLFEQVAGACEAIHATEHAHADLTPGNIVISEDTRGQEYAKVLDLGVSIAFGEPLSAWNPGYPSAEVLDALPIDARYDQYTLAFGLYELLTGRFVYASGGAEQRAKRLSEPGFPPPLVNVRSDIEAPLSDTLARAMSLHPDDRFESYEEFTARVIEAMVSEATRRTSVGIGFVTRSSDPQPPGPGELTLLPTPEGRGRRALALDVLDRRVDAAQVGPGVPETIVISADPTLDDLLAAELLRSTLEGRDLGASMREYATYAANVRTGLRPDGERVAWSLKGVFAAIRRLAARDDADLDDPELARSFLTDWKRVFEVIADAARRGLPPEHPELFAGPQFWRERAYLAGDAEIYARDRDAGQTFTARVPGHHGELRALVLDQPRSFLFADWSREDESVEGGRGFELLVVRTAPGQWVLSTDPMVRISLRPLAEALSDIERAESTEARPWFDGAPFRHSLIATALEGSTLSDERVLAAIRELVRAD